MSKRAQKPDPNQMALKFADRVDRHLRETSDVRAAIFDRPLSRVCESYDEACFHLAKAIKTALAESGLSREQLCDAINRYFGWPTEDEAAALKAAKKRIGRRLSIHMLTHHLSKPSQYPIPAPYLYAIQHITRSLDPCRAIAEDAGAEVVTREEKDALLLGKLEQHNIEMGNLRRQLKKRLRRA